MEDNLARPLGPMEYGYWIMDFAARTNFVFQAELTADIPEEVLGRALAAVQAKRPMMRMAVARGRKGLPEFTPSDRSIPLGNLDLPDRDGAYLAALEEENHKPLDWENGPLCRVTRITGNGGACLWFTFHHVGADGISGAGFVRDVLLAAASLMEGREAQVADVWPEGPAEALFLSRYNGLRGFAEAMAFMAGTSFAKMALGRFDSLPLDQEVSPEKRRQRFLLRKLPADTVAGLVARAKARGTGVHGAISAAELLAMAGEMPDVKTPLIPHLSLVDLRRRVATPVSPESMSVFISAAETRHRISPETDFWALAREVDREIRREIDSGTIFTYWAWMIRLVMATRALNTPDLAGSIRVLKQGEMSRPSAAIVSNIGKVDAPEDFGPFSLKGLGFVISLSGSGFFAAAAASFRKRLFLNFTYAWPSISEERAERLADRTVEILHQAAGEGPAPEEEDRP